MRVRCLLYLTIALASALNWTAAAAEAAERARATATPAATAEAGGDYVVGLSPFLDPAVKDTVFRALVRLAVEDLPLGSSLEVFDAYDLRSVARLSVPNLKVFDSAKTRANQFAAAIGEMRAFLAQDHPKPAGYQTNLGAAIRLPQFLDFLNQNRPAPREGARLSVLLAGSPLYQDAKEPDFSMTEGRFPSDAHLRASRADSIYGLQAGDGAALPCLVSWVFFGDPWLSDLHREKVGRFWSLYVEARGGRLASFSGDLETAMSAFVSKAQGRSAAEEGWSPDARQTKLEMVRVNRTVRQVDWRTGDTAALAAGPPAQMTGSLKIGIRWKDDIDLDLYARPRHGAETLFFQHTRSPEGYYDVDHRSSPGHEYEYVEFEEPVDIREAQAFVNFFAGSCPQGPRGEVRIEFQNRIYHGSFAIEAKEGNQGRTGPSQSSYWTRIPIQKILHLEEAAPQAANTVGSDGASRLQ